MKTVVLVTDIEFWSHSIGSHTRIQRLARGLSASHNLVVFLLRSVTAESSAAFSTLALKNAKLVSYKQYSGAAASHAGRVSKLPFFKKFAVDDFTSSLLLFLQETPADYLMVEYIRLGYLLDACPQGMKTILDMHDVMSLRTISLRQAGLKASIEMDAATERDILARFDRVLAISRYDQGFLAREMGLTNTLYVPCSVEDMATRDSLGSGRRLIFTGGRTAPNIEGLRWFLSQVWPILATAGLVLDMVGPVCDAFPSVPAGVRLHGQQNDLQSFLAAADIAINPVFVGGGLKIKCIEALSAGLPCVTTIEGAAGLDAARDAGLVVATGRLAFIAAIRHFASSEDDRRAVAHLAPRYVRSEFSDQVAYASLEAYLGGEIVQPGRTAP
jgi:hypothetical protein